MVDLSTLAVFVAASLLLAVTPGPAVLYILARGIDQGPQAGIISTLGIAAGTLFHIAAAALGVSAVLATSALAYNTVKYLGAVYLVYLGIRKLMAQENREPLWQIKHQPLRRIFFQGMLVNLLNPKTALFFLAFLPQFADVSRGALAIQLMLLGMIFMTIALISDTVYALAAGNIGQWLKDHPRFTCAQHLVSGTVFIALGIAAAFSGSGKK